MKNNLQTNPFLLKMIALVACFMLVILYNKSKATGIPTVSKYVTRVSVNFKHDPEKNELKIRVKSGTEDIMQLFIFSPDGILITEVPVCKNKITIIKGLKKGLYLYEWFNNDERMKSGTLIIN